MQFGGARTPLAKLGINRKYVSLPVGKSPQSSSSAVSKSMRSNKASGTKPELTLSRLLRKKIRRNSLPGRPDFAYSREKVAVFVNGCFWHRCPACNLPIPRRNSSFWKRKFSRNVERDELNRKELEAKGWTVVELWEHEIKTSPKDSSLKVLNALNRSLRGDRLNR